MQNEEGIDAEQRTIVLTAPDGRLTTHNYDILVGADGARSLVRQAIVKREKRMKSQLSYVGPMRYVTALGLEAQPPWLVPSVASMTSPPLQSLAEEPLIKTAGARRPSLRLCCQRATLAQ